MMLLVDVLVQQWVVARPMDPIEHRITRDDHHDHITHHHDYIWGCSRYPHPRGHQRRIRHKVNYKGNKD